MAPLYSQTNFTRLEGKVAVISGGSSGIGKEIVRDLSSRGARVISLSRQQEKAEKAAEDILRETKQVTETIKLNLASLKSVRECAELLLEKEDKIDFLINNAGVFACPDWKTEDGFEMQFGVNHLGHFLLTELLMPLLRKSAENGFEPRIIIVSSNLHKQGTMYWDDLHFENRTYNKLLAYTQSKLANILHAKELAKRYQSEGIVVCSTHPGGVNTSLFRHVKTTWYGRLFGSVMQPFLSSPLEGAQTTLYCLLEPEIVQGGYYGHCQEKRPSQKALSEDDQKKLWQISEILVGLKPAQ